MQLLYFYGIFFVTDTSGDDVIRINTIYFDRYRILERIGSGTYGEVYKVCQINLNSIRALKCIDKCYADYDTVVREANILKNLRHPGIPIIYDIEEDEECVYIIEEFVEGLSLDSQIKRQKFSVSEAVYIVKKLCGIIEYLHGEGFFHQDIKPANIIYHKHEIKLIDYGSAGRLGERYEYNTGTKGFAAPETYGSNTMERTSDIYSVGIVLLVLLTGKADTNSIAQVKPPELVTIIRKCMSHSKRARYSTVSELQMELNRLSRKKNVSQKVSRHIALIGAYPHCGTTHTAIILANVIRKHNKHVLICEENPSGDFFHILVNEERVSFNGGIFQAEGIDFLPCYDGCMEAVEENSYDFIIHDYGAYANNLKDIVMTDRICLVSGSKPYEIREAELVADQLIKNDVNVKGKLYTLCLFSDYRDYCKLLRNPKVINPIRIAYETCPAKYRIKGIEKCFEEKK